MRHHCYELGEPISVAERLSYVGESLRDLLNSKFKPRKHNLLNHSRKSFFLKLHQLPNAGLGNVELAV